MPTPEADLHWRKSSHSGGAQQCVEVAHAQDGGYWLRDSKNPQDAAHYFTPTQWDAFIKDVKDGEFG